MSRMLQASRSGRRGLVAAVGACALVAGCGGSSQSAGAPSTSPSASVTLGASSPAAGSSSATASGGSSSAASDAGSVAPSSGTPVTLTAVSLNYPAGWEVQRQDAISIAGFDPQGAGDGQLFVDDNSGYDVDTVDSLAKSAIKFATVKPVTRGPNRVVAGVEGYTLTGAGSDADTYYAWGGPVNGREVEIQLFSSADAPDVQSVVDSVLASVTFG